MSHGQDDSVSGLQQRLQHEFTDIALLERALTHPSAPDVIEGRRRSYQRLEFLGDRVLGLVVADMVFRDFPDSAEGELSRLLTRLVRKETCAKVAAGLGVGAHIIMGEGEAKTGGRSKKAILGDVCEAVIAALYLDGGMDAARRFIEGNWTPFLTDGAPLSDAKTALQEWAHRKSCGTPVYKVRSRTGPDHSPEFVIEVLVEGTEPETGRGPSKRVAEQAAARTVLVREGAWTR